MVKHIALSLQRARVRIPLGLPIRTDSKDGLCSGLKIHLSPIVTGSVHQSLSIAQLDSAQVLYTCYLGSNPCREAIKHITYLPIDRYVVKLQEVNMKYYILSYVVDGGRTIYVHKKFRTRIDAINYTFKKLPSNAELLYEINRGNHHIEYVCNNFNRFFINRCVA